MTEYKINSYEDFKSKKSRRIAQMFSEQAPYTMGEILDDSIKNPLQLDEKISSRMILQNSFVMLMVDYELREYELGDKLILTPNFLNKKSLIQKDMDFPEFPAWPFPVDSPKKIYEENIIKLELDISVLEQKLTNQQVN